MNHYAHILASLMALFILACVIEKGGQIQDAGAAVPDMSSIEASEPTTVEIWAELCAAATIEERCDNQRCQRQAVIPMDVYCQYYECALHLADYEEQFSTCDSPTREWPVCAWEREVGCGVVQFTQPNDESAFYAIAFNEADGSIFGFMVSSDSSLRKCGADDYRVGTFDGYLNIYDANCNEVQSTLCCHREPAHLW